MQIGKANRAPPAMTGAHGERVLVLAPSGVDAEVLCRALFAAGIEALECETLHELHDRVREGAAGAILADEMLDAAGIATVLTILDRQPEWSDLPLIVMARHGQEQGRAWRLLRKMNGAAHAVLLERPVHTVTLVSAVSAALRSRARQYQVRDELARLRRTEEELRESERRLRELTATLEGRVAERTAELERQTLQLRLLANELTQAEQRERKSLARTVHDGLQQMLLAVKMQLPFCAGEGRAQALQKIGELVDDSMRMAHSLAYELSPPVLELSELPTALEWLARWFSENHRFDVYLDVSADFPTVAENVKVFLFNAVRELLFNAVKHSGAGEAFVLLQTAQPHMLRIEVCDEGVGFDPARLGEAVEVSGFGLFSVRERLSALGGSLEVRSSPGEGSRFIISMPAVDGESIVDTAPANESTVPDPGPARPWTRGERIRVLVVDDHLMVREGLATMIRQREGFELVGQAADGVEAIERTEDLHPDVVIMDIRMPRMDGIEATRRIKERHPQVQIIGLSLHSVPQQADAMLQAGAAVCLSKDGAAEALFDTMSAIGRGSD